MRGDPAAGHLCEAVSRTTMEREHRLRNTFVRRARRRARRDRL